MQAEVVVQELPAAGVALVLVAQIILTVLLRQGTVVLVAVLLE
jgi:hypothetical protein